MLFDESREFIFYDGAMGTMLQERGLKPGGKPDLMNITDPGAVEEIHRLYVGAGSDIICTNTFGASAYGLRGTGHSPEEVISAAVAIARRAAGAAAKVALDIGPIGELLEPMGELAAGEAAEIFAQQAIAGEKAGADCVAIETMSDLNEMEAAVRAVAENTSLPILASMTFSEAGYTFTGCTPEKFAELAAALGASAVGINCSLEPARMFAVAGRIAKASSLPMIVKLNAGLPDAITGRYSVGPAEFARQMLPYADIGARIIGGCCGTSPEYIRELKTVLNSKL